MPNPKKNMIKSALSLKGIEGLTDGVFAIVMTLLVLDLGVPILTGSSTHQEFVPLLKMWPEFACYFVTFLMLGFVWSMHHRVFSVMKCADSISIWLNIICLMFASLLPFSTSFLAANLGQRLPILTYEGNFLFIALLGYLNWSYVTGKYRLVNTDIDSREIRQRKIQFMSGTLLSAIAIGIAYLNAIVSISIFVVFLVSRVILAAVQSRIHITEQVAVTKQVAKQANTI